MSIDTTADSTSAQNTADLPWYFGNEVPTHIASHLRAPLQSFLENGYVVLEDSIPAKTCDLVVAEFWKLHDANPQLFDRHKDADGHFPRFVNLQAVLPSLLRLFSENKSALEIQDPLYGDKTTLYTSLFYERGSWQPLHRDTPYFTTRPEYKYFGMWVALEDVDQDNGPLMVAPGGHRLPELDREAIALSHYPDLDSLPSGSQELWDSYQSAVGEQVAANNIEVIPLPVKKGSTIIWHPQLPHGGSPIRNLNRTRFSLVVHTTPPHMPVYHQDVFFNPSRDYPTRADWRYNSARGRHYIRHDVMSFGHDDPHPASDFAGLRHLTGHDIGDRMSSFLSSARRKARSMITQS